MPTSRRFQSPTSRSRWKSTTWVRSTPRELWSMEWRLEKRGIFLSSGYFLDVSPKLMKNGFNFKFCRRSIGDLRIYGLLSDKVCAEVKFYLNLISSVINENSKTIPKFVLLPFSWNIYFLQIFNSEASQTRSKWNFFHTKSQFLLFTLQILILNVSRYKFKDLLF